jgi:hypothetical protein
VIYRRAAFQSPHHVASSEQGGVQFSTGETIHLGEFGLYVDVADGPHGLVASAHLAQADRVVLVFPDGRIVPLSNDRRAFGNFSHKLNRAGTELYVQHGSVTDPPNGLDVYRVSDGQWLRNEPCENDPDGIRSVEPIVMAHQMADERMTLDDGRQVTVYDVQSDAGWIAGGADADLQGQDTYAPFLVQPNGQALMWPHKVNHAPFLAVVDGKPRLSINHAHAPDPDDLSGWVPFVPWAAAILDQPPVVPPPPAPADCTAERARIVALRSELDTARIDLSACESENRNLHTMLSAEFAARAGLLTPDQVLKLVNDATGQMAGYWRYLGVQGAVDRAVKAELAKRR